MNQDFVEMLSELSAARVEFEEAWINHIHVKIQGIEIPVIGKTEKPTCPFGVQRTMKIVRQDA